MITKSIWYLGLINVFYDYLLRRENIETRTFVIQVSNKYIIDNYGVWVDNHGGEKEER